MPRSDTYAQSLLGIVGWRLSADDTCAEELPESLTASRSGLIVQDLSEMLSTVLIRHIIPEGEELADFLERITLDVTRKLATRLLTEKTLPAKVLMQAAPLLNGQGSLTSTVNPLGRFVGIRLNLARYEGVVTTIPRIGLQLASVLPEPLPLYVYSTEQDEPVAVVNFQNTRAGYTHWQQVPELNISFASGEETAYIGYYEQDLNGARAVQRDFRGLPCGCPNDPFSHYGTHAWPKGFSVRAELLNEDRTLWPLESAVVETQNFGLNLELTSVCDILSVLGSEENQAALAEALQMALAIRILSGIVATTNITQLTARQDVQADALALLYRYEAMLYGGKEVGTDNYYPSMLKNVVLDLSGLDAVCQTTVKDRLSMGYLTDGR